MNTPNIILIVAEELGQDSLPFAGNVDAEAPFIDELSRKSATFFNHFTVHGKCVPSRAALFSGRYCHNGGHRTLGIELQQNEPSLAQILKNNGYFNVLVGKNHTIDSTVLMDQFNEHWTEGLDHRKTLSYGDYTEKTTSNNRTKGNKYADNYLFGKLNLNKDDVIDAYYSERVCDFIENKKLKNPFFININFSYTHPPYEIMDPYYTHFMGKDLSLFPNEPGTDKPDFMYRMWEEYGFDRLSKRDRKEMLACYYGQIAHLDEQVRKIYHSLEKKGLIGNTIIILTSDHGDFVGRYGLPEKWDTIFTDCITKIPLMVHYPKRIQPVKIDAMTENIDLLPTIARFLNIDLPHGIQGISLDRLISGETENHREYVFSEGGHEKELLEIEIKPNPFRKLIAGYLIKARIRDLYPDSLRKAKMIRTKKHKLVYRVVDRCEFYDLENDPLEQKNVYSDPIYSELINDFEKKLLIHLIESEENLPFDPQPIS